MWSARFERLKTLFVSIIFTEASESEAEREIAYVRERLQNNFLLSTNSSSMPLALTNHDPLQVPSQGVAGHPCRAH